VDSSCGSIEVLRTGSMVELAARAMGDDFGFEIIAPAHAVTPRP
jgi:hypothetical protein